MLAGEVGGRTCGADRVASGRGGWGGPDGGWAADRVTFGGDLGLSAQDQTEGARQGGDVERFVVLIQNENFAVHMIAIVAGGLRPLRRRLARWGGGGVRA